MSGIGEYTVVIEPTTKVTVINKMIIKRVEVILNQYAEITIDLFDESDKYVSSKFLIMSDEDYANWGSDDTYLIDWVKTHLTL
jgi:hypothetical protein